MNDLRAELQAALGGAYTVERELGGGGMSHLFVARDLALGRDVVVKVVAAQAGARLSIERFRREVSLAASLQHPHIVSVLAAGEVAGLPYFLMPYVEGQSVRQRLEGGPLSVPDTVAILRDVARALAYAHARGVVHRDIKPDNVLLAGGSAMINDFGIAKALASARVTPTPAPSGVTLTQEGLALGTPGYMAPEQVAGDPNVDHRADVYAFGALAYEMLTGAGPFKDKTPHELLAAQLTEAPRPITGMRDGLPVRLADLVMACLERHPNDRPQTAAELVRALDDPAVISGAVATRPVPLRARRRWLMPAVLTAAGAAIVAAGAVVLSKGTAAAPPNSVAVLPLTNAGADSAAYLADGLTDEITLALSRLPGVRVASPSAAATYRGRSMPPAEIGRALGVATLLEGSVQMSGGRLRLVARLTDARNGQTLWSQGYEGAVRDIFAVQDSIAGAIAEAFRARFGATGAAVGTAARGAQGTGDVAAYDAFLRGRFLFQRRTPEALRRALAAFQEAIAKDPGFARAYAGLGDVYAVLPLYTNVPAESTQSLAFDAVEQALAIDSTLSDARASRGYLNMLLWRWADAERDLRAATRGDSANVTAWQWFGEWLLYNGHTREAVDALTHASSLAPASGLLVALRAVALAVDRRPGEAVPLAQRAVSMDSALVALPFMQGAVLAYAGRPAEAIAPLEATRRGGLDVPPVIGLLGYAHAAAGQRDRAEALRDSLLARAGAPGATGALAHIWLGLGDTAQVLTWLEWAAGAHDALFASQSLAAPLYDPVRLSPRFAEVVRRVGLDGARLTRLPGRR